MSYDAVAFLEGLFRDAPSEGADRGQAASKLAAAPSPVIGPDADTGGESQSEIPPRPPDRPGNVTELAYDGSAWSWRQRELDEADLAYLDWSRAVKLTSPIGDELILRDWTDLPADWRVDFEERAAIREYDGHQAREHAEAEALREIIAQMRRVGWKYG